ncbi:MAG TPA: L,D-transpeptidase family protein [Solirubrobacteraceae bacterium]|nr:L,D-transpeptidase family protein [Solirubrobacteraceae bacterium]
MRRALALVLLLAAAVPAAARADAPTAATPTIKLVVEKAGGDRDPIALTGEHFRVRVIVTPYVPGQTVTVRVQRGASKLRVKQLAITRPAGATAGQALIGFTPKSGGRLRIRASHLATPELGTAVAPERTVSVVSGKVAGGRGPSVRLLQRLLARKGYVTGQRGLFDARTARAVLAFRKLSGLVRTAVADRTVFRRLVKGGGAFAVRYPKHGHHVEADLTHQVIALIDHGRVQRIYPISSGKPSTPTVLGNFRVYRKDPGTNAKGMVFSSYFTGGYAIHGYADVPTYAASHGCLRTPVPDAVPIYDWVKLGDRVDVYYRSGEHGSKRIANPGP